MRIALVDDDTHVSQLLCLWLEGAGHQYHLFATGTAFLKASGRETFDLVVLDWMLPDTTGDKLLAWLRGHSEKRVPVIFVTARDSEEDIVAGLNQGADDYITKPVRQHEFLARVQAVARRTVGESDNNRPVIEFPPYRIDTGTRTVELSGKVLDLTHKEFELASYLFRNVGRMLSRGHILDAVWGQGGDINTRTVDTHMSRLRTKLELFPENGWRLSAIYNLGYRLERLGVTEAAGQT
jgi:DNA-binding response OmpR family regulator